MGGTPSLQCRQVPAAVDCMPPRLSLSLPALRMVRSDILTLLLKFQVDQWLDFAPQLVAGASFAAACEAANAALTLRTYLAGHSISVADVAVWGQLKGVIARSSVGPLPQGHTCLQNLPTRCRRTHALLRCLVVRPGFATCM